MEFYLLAPGIVGGDKDKARDTAARIAGVDRVQGYLAKARLAEASGDWPRQEAMLRQAVEAGPAQYRPRVALAQFLLLRGQREAAREHAAIAMNIDSTRVDSYSVLAAVYASGGQNNELEELLTAAARKIPDDLSPYYRAAETLLSEGRDLDRAQQYFRRYLSAEPEGNAPPHAEASGKLTQVLAKRKEVSGTSAAPVPSSGPAR